MRIWFAKKSAENKATTNSAIVQGRAAPAVLSVADPGQRRVIRAPMLASADAAFKEGEIPIKAKINPYANQIVLLADRPLLDGYSFWCVSKTEAATWSPLALALFESGNLASILIHEMNITVTRKEIGTEADDVLARRLGQIARTHLESGLPAVAESFFAGMPSEQEMVEALQGAIDKEINPGIAGHSGKITLTAVIGNTAYIKMGGGCQGCAASNITLRQGVEQSFRTAMPRLGALLDETDHAAGRAPFMTALPEDLGT